MTDVTALANPSNLAAVTGPVVDAGVAPDLLQPSNQVALLADASVAHALNATFSDTEVEGALNTLGGKINSLIDCVVAAGLMKSA